MLLQNAPKRGWTCCYNFGGSIEQNAFVIYQIITIDSIENYRSVLKWRHYAMMSSFFSLPNEVQELVIWEKKFPWSFITRVHCLLISRIPLFPSLGNITAKRWRECDIQLDPNVRVNCEVEWFAFMITPHIANVVTQWCVFPYHKCRNAEDTLTNRRYSNTYRCSNIPHYGLDLSPRDFYVFGFLKISFNGRKF